MAHLLVVEDESDVRELLALHLKREGYTVTAFENAEDAQRFLVKQKIDLAVLDWMLPQMTGVDLCRWIRSQQGPHLPILLLTARADTLDKVVGLEIGADDYLTKPFEPREFIARVRALLRRSQTNLSKDPEFRFRDLKLNIESKRAFIGKQEIPLTPNEFKLMVELMKQPGVTLDRETLIALIQGPNVAVVDRTIDTTILGLRKKLGDHADLIETVRGFGYRMKSQSTE